MRIGSCIAAALALLFAAQRADALDSGQPVNSYLRTRLTTDDGLPSNIVDGIVQSRDGFLWLTLGSEELVRFDGRRFASISIPRARAMAIAPDGDLWVGSGSDLKQISTSALNQFVPLPATTDHIG